MTTNNNNNSNAIPSTVTDNCTRYKITKTITDASGKTRTETIEVVDNDAVKAMQDLRLQDNSLTNTNRFSFSSLMSRLRGPQPVSIAPNNDEFVQEALKVHNEVRQKHGVEPLRLNNDLSKLAQQWANHLASTGSLLHSKTKYRNMNVGENLRCQSWPITGKEMTEAWYDESNKYNYNNRQVYQPGTGHFTQIVWKNSQEVGFACAQGKSMNFAVAMYYPAGNFIGEFHENVFPPR